MRIPPGPVRCLCPVNPAVPCLMAASSQDVRQKHHRGHPESISKLRVTCALWGGLISRCQTAGGGRQSVSRVVARQCKEDVGARIVRQDG